MPASRLHLAKPIGNELVGHRIAKVKIINEPNNACIFITTENRNPNGNKGFGYLAQVVREILNVKNCFGKKISGVSSDADRIILIHNKKILLIIHAPGLGYMPFFTGNNTNYKTITEDFHV